MAKYELTPKREAVLRVLGRRHPRAMSAVEIAKVLEEKSTSVRNILAKGLFQYGYVIREESSDPKCKHAYQLSEKGLKFAGKSKHVTVSELDQWLEPKPKKVEINQSARGLLVDLGTHVREMNTIIQKLMVVLGG